MAYKLRRALSFGSDQKKDKIVQSSKHRIPKSNLDQLHQWTIPQEKIEKIYKIGTFEFKTAYSIKTHEETHSIQNKFQEIPLLNKEAINDHLKAKYSHIHFCLIQVVVKPLSRLGIDSPIYIALRDKR